MSSMHNVTDEEGSGDLFENQVECNAGGSSLTTTSSYMSAYIGDLSNENFNAAKGNAKIITMDELPTDLINTVEHTASLDCNVDSTEELTTTQSHKWGKTSVSDDEVYGSGRAKRIGSKNSSQESISSRSSPMLEEDVSEQKPCQDRTDSSILKRSRIPRPITKIKKVLDAVDIMDAENSMKNYEATNISLVTVIDSSTKDVPYGQQCSSTEPETLPNERKKRNDYASFHYIPEKKPDMQTNSSKPKLSPPTPERSPRKWCIARGKIVEKPTNLTKDIKNKPVSWPGNLEPTSPKTKIRVTPTSKILDTFNDSSASSMFSKDTSNSSSVILDNGPKLATLNRRYKLQLLKYNGQNKEFQGLSVQLNGTRKTLTSLDDQIRKLGHIPPGDFDPNEATTLISNCNNCMNKNTNEIKLPIDGGSIKIDKGVSTCGFDSTTNSNQIPDFAVKLQEENKALLEQIESLQGENAFKNSWFSKYMKEMIALDQCSEMTGVSCDSTLTRQDELNIKLDQCDRAVKELTNLTKETKSYKATISKLKSELTEEQAKLESEKKKRTETEARLNMELVAERGKLKNVQKKKETLQTQLSAVSREKSNLVNKNLEVTSQFQELQDLLVSLQSTVENGSQTITLLQDTLKEKENVLKLAESAILELREDKNILENQIVQMDLGSQTSHGSVVEMSKQLLNKDAQLSELKCQRDRAFNENSALSELLHYLANLNSIDLTTLQFEEIINDPNEMCLIKEKIKEACRKLNSSVSESLVREQAKEIKEQLTNVQNLKEEINKSNDRMQELVNLLESRENEMANLKEECNQQSEKLKLMEGLGQGEITLRQEIGIETSGKLTIGHLLSMLVAKGESLARMENQINRLEYAHSMCARRKSRGESRVALLESALHDQVTSWKEVATHN